MSEKVQHMVLSTKQRNPDAFHIFTKPMPPSGLFLKSFNTFQKVAEKLN